MSRSSELKIRDIPLADIDRSHNHRLPRPGDKERLEEMKRSIAAGGQLQAIRVYERGEDQKDAKHKQPYILGFGARRCEAMEKLGRTTIRAIVYPPATYAEIAQAKAVENLHRLDLTPLEEVMAVDDVLEAIKADSQFTGDPYEEAATRLGCEITWVKDRDYLHRLTKPVQKFALRSGLPAGHLRELAKVGDPKDQMRLACECAGAPSHVFPADAKEKVAQWQEQQQEQYFAQLADGKVIRWPLTHLKDQVARVQLSLRQIPWIFDQPVEFGSIKLRKCAGCPHNSETDRTLFGIDEDAANPNGYCLHPSCYNTKHETADAAKAQVFKKVSQKKDQSPTMIRSLTPEWLKEEPVVGYVRRQQEKAEKAKETGNDDAGTANTSTARRNASNGGRTLTAHEEALVKYAEAMERWYADAQETVFKAINGEPAYKVSWCVLLGVKAFWEQPSLTFPQVHRYSQQPTTEEPVLPPLPEELAQITRLAFKGNRNSLLEVLKDEEQFHPDNRPGMGPIHPAALQLLAQLMEVKLSDMPLWQAPAAAAPVADATAVASPSQEAMA